ncbi:nudC domain-containing protein 3 [Exaiptasia diaphana]|uniref:CS domain-containing protein n=1 Tax=Exaiptasia diaphana TaxID=2652724 RepID=A0A913X9Y0_EXADI|nr:nudC domain-containing protein 3 [Exaiptasia diaphana]KXJ26549.1 NudC domain-containing protein 3 [Exaiptasia diaphana]
MDLSQLDNIFLGILQNCGQIEPFLDVVFSFLARRTDFYVIMNSKQDKMGFPDGIAEQMVLKIFRKYQRVVLGSMNKEKETKSTRKMANKEKEITETCKPHPNSISQSSAEVTSSEEMNNTPTTVPDVVASTVEVSSTDTSQNTTEQTIDDFKHSTNDLPDQKTSDEPTAASTSTQSSNEESKFLEPGKLPDCYNGAVLDKYTWSQTIKDIDLKIPVPKCILRARDVAVEIKMSSLKVSLKGNIPVEELKTGSNVLVDGKLQRCVKCEESMWSLEPGKTIQINLEKAEERFWTAICEGDPEIDKTKVDSTRAIDDFDEQTQTDFQQVMYDHQQKMMGKPTSKEQKTHDLLKQAWDAKGSPFAGTPFDPSKVNISG